MRDLPRGERDERQGARRRSRGGERRLGNVVEVQSGYADEGGEEQVHVRQRGLHALHCTATLWQSQSPSLARQTSLAVFNGMRLRVVQ